MKLGPAPLAERTAMRVPCVYPGMGSYPRETFSVRIRIDLRGAYRRHRAHFVDVDGEVEFDTMEIFVEVSLLESRALLSHGVRRDKA